MDEFRFWSYARNANEIASHQNCSLSGMEEGLIVYYDFEEGIQNGNNQAITAVANKTAYNYPAEIQDISLNGDQSNYVHASSTFLDGMCPTDLFNCQLEVLSLNGQTINNDLYHGIDTIYSTAIITTDLFTEFKAGDAIILKPGFHAQAGSTLSVMVEDCANDNLQPNNYAASSRLTNTIDPTTKLTVTISPNPIRQQAKIEYELPFSGKVNLIVSNMSGKQVEMLLTESYQESGKHQVVWYADHFDQGVYFVSLQTKDKIVTKKMIVLK